MQIREVWPHDGNSVQFYCLVNGRYDLISTSFELPGLEVARIDRFFDQRLRTGETTYPPSESISGSQDRCVGPSGLWSSSSTKAGA